MFAELLHFVLSGNRDFLRSPLFILQLLAPEKQTDMLGLRLIRMTLAAFGLLLACYGTLLLFMSMTTRPALSAYAVVFLGATAAITWSLKQTS